jgi:lipoate-protein ligase A
MRWLDLTLPDLAANLALDEALLLEAEAGDLGEVLRVWEWASPAVILGAGCRRSEDVNVAACQADGVPILRRASGGGTVLLGRGCLLYSLVLAYDRSPLLREVRSSYRYILGKLAAALGGRPAEVALAGTSDLAVAGRKLSGNAQQRKRRFLLHHGTLLYEFDLARVGRYLHLPRRQPDYRRARDHMDFLLNLPIPADDLKQQLRSAWEADEHLESWPEGLVDRLAAEKYSQLEWINRRS